MKLEVIIKELYASQFDKAKEVQGGLFTQVANSNTCLIRHHSTYKAYVSFPLIL